MGATLGTGSGGPKSEINVTPFVDVVLVLLIIFMVLTPLILRELSVLIPRRADASVTADVAAQQAILHLHKDGRLTLNQSPVRRADLPQRLRQMFEKRNKRVLFVRIDDQVNYGDAVAVMDSCRGAGIRTLGMTMRE